MVLIYLFKNVAIVILIFCIILSVQVLIVRLATLRRLKALKRIHKDTSHIIGFFHPQCDSGGGGEKVLFQAI